MSNVLRLLIISIVNIFHTSLSSPFQNTSPVGLPDLQRLVRPVDSLRMDSSIVLSSDSAYFRLPPTRAVLYGTSTAVQLIPRCRVDSVYIYVRHSYSRCDTIARLLSPPYQTVWNYSDLPDQDQIHLQFGYKIFQPDGKVIISRPRPHQWVIDRSPKRSRKTYHCIQILKPDTPLIDGRLEDWKRIRFTAIGEGARFAICWSPSHLYFAAEITEGRPGLSDCLELHLDPRRTCTSFASETHRSIRFTPGGRCYFIVACKKNGEYDQCDSIAALLREGSAWRTAVCDTGYTVEAAVPFYALSDLDFPLLRFGLEVTLTTSGGKFHRFYAWAKSREYNRYNPSEWGTIVLHQAMPHVKIAMIVGMVIAALVSIAIAVTVIRHFFLNERYEYEEAKGGSNSLREIRESIKRLLADKTLSIEKFSALTGIPVEEVNKTLNKELECNFERFLCFQRISAVKELLWDFDLPVDLIAEKCGFSSTEEMTKRFREYFKTDPLSFRAKNREAASDEGIQT